MDSIPIPRDLDLQLVEPAAAENLERSKLFTCLDVKGAEVKEIRSKILKMYKTSGDCEHINLTISREHLHFLYLTHHAAEEINCSDRIQIYDQGGEMHRPSLLDLYIPDDRPYGPRVLLGDTSVYFIDDTYLDDLPEKPSSVDLTWTEWLHKYIGVRRDLRLVNTDNSDISLACKWVGKNRPNKFLEFLKHLWPYEGDLVLSSSHIQDQLTEIKVLCMAGRTHELIETYLPLSNLQRYCKRFMEKDEFFSID